MGGTVCSLDIPRNAMLLANNKEKLYSNQVVAEIKKEANLILEEDQKDIYTEVSGEVFLQKIDVEETIDNQGAIKQISKTNGLIWVLYGDRYILPNSCKIDLNVGQHFSQNDNIASQKIINNYPGIIDFSNWTNNGEINVINSSMTIENGVVRKNSNGFDILELGESENKKLFELTIKPNESIKHGQTIACLKEDNYRTETGG